MWFVEHPADEVAEFWVHSELHIEGHSTSNSSLNLEAFKMAEKPMKQTVIEEGCLLRGMFLTDALLDDIVDELRQLAMIAHEYDPLVCLDHRDQQVEGIGTCCLVNDDNRKWMSISLCADITEEQRG